METTIFLQVLRFLRNDYRPYFLGVDGFGWWAFGCLPVMQALTRKRLIGISGDLITAADINMRLDCLDPLWHPMVVYQTCTVLELLKSDTYRQKLSPESD